MESAQGRFSRVLTIRMDPGSDVLEELETACREYGVKNGVILSGLGSWSRVAYSNPDVLEGGRIGYSAPIIREGLMELVALSGIICHNEDGSVSPHVHLTLTSGGGAAFGGHMQYGCKVLMTTDVVIGEVEGVDMQRRFHPEMQVPLFYPVQL